MTKLGRKLSCLQPVKIIVNDAQGRPLQTTVSCRNCRPCMDHHKRKKAGQLLAEMKTSERAHMVTLTYRDKGTGMRPHEFHYTDVQLFMKRLRRNNPNIKFRFACFGELGSKKLRVHWHLTLFECKFDDKPYIPWEFPSHDANGRTWIDEWPHGHINVKPLTKDTAIYACKYAVKDLNKLSHNEPPRQSAGEALGASYVKDWARRMAIAGAHPKAWTYKIDGIAKLKKTDEAFDWPMTEALKKHFQETYTETYEATHGKMPTIELFEKFTENEIDPTIPMDFRPSFRHSTYIEPWVEFSDNEAKLQSYFENEIKMGTYQGIPLSIEHTETETILTSETETWRVDHEKGRLVERTLRNATTTTRGIEMRNRNFGQD